MDTTKKNMMGDLISRKALLASYDEQHKGPPRGARELIKDAPSVPTVPIDKLCEWLAENAWHINCSDCDGEHCDCPQLHDDGSSPAFWKAKLTKWMEEQDDAN